VNETSKSYPPWVDFLYDEMYGFGSLVVGVPELAPEVGVIDEYGGSDVRYGVIAVFSVASMADVIVSTGCVETPPSVTARLSVNVAVLSYTFGVTVVKQFEMAGIHVSYRIVTEGMVLGHGDGYVV